MIYFTEKNLRDLLIIIYFQIMGELGLGENLRTISFLLEVLLDIL